MHMLYLNKHKENLMPKAPKTAKANPISNPLAQLSRFIFILVGLAGAFTFSVRIALQPEINLTALENDMNSSASSIMLLESDPEDSSSKTFSRTYGNYLVGESTAWYAELLALTNINLALNILGLIASVIIFALGLRPVKP